MTKLVVRVTQEIHRELIIDVEDYHGSDKVSATELCEFFYRVKSDPMHFINCNDDGTDEVGENTSQSVTLIEED